MENTKASRVLSVIGLLLILAAIVWTVRNTVIQANAGEAVQAVVQQLYEQIPQAEPQTSEASAATAVDLSRLPDYMLNPEMPMPVVEINGLDYIGYIELPSLELTLSVCSTWDYDALNISPCRYSGSAYLNNLVIAGHNYSTHFANLSQVQPGDPVILTDIDGNVFRYRAVLVEVLEATDVEKMTESDFDLTLFTCTIGGASRVALRCNRIMFP